MLICAYLCLCACCTSRHQHQACVWRNTSSSSCRCQACVSQEALGGALSTQQRRRRPHHPALLPQVRSGCVLTFWCLSPAGSGSRRARATALPRMCALAAAPAAQEPEPCPTPMSDDLLLALLSVRCTFTMSCCCCCFCCVVLCCAVLLQGLLLWWCAQVRARRLPCCCWRALLPAEAHSRLCSARTGHQQAQGRRGCLEVLSCAAGWFTQQTHD
jgi:hypothetical protein